MNVKCFCVRVYIFPVERQ